VYVFGLCMFWIVYVFWFVYVFGLRVFLVCVCFWFAHVFGVFEFAHVLDILSFYAQPLIRSSRQPELNRNKGRQRTIVIY